MRHSTSAVIFIPIEYCNGDIFLGGKIVPHELFSLIKQHFSSTDEEIEVIVKCTHSFTKARIYGDPNDCYPAEQYEERNVQAILFPDGTEINNSPSGMDLKHFLFRELSVLIQDFVDEYELDYRD